jgi:O-antigen biosynthesis protein
VSILVELDHDDELTPDALEKIAQAAEPTFPDFIFSDWCEVFADGTTGRYPEGWGLGYGRDSWNKQHQAWQLSVPVINEETIKHIVGVPNHVRVWKRNFYHNIRGHDVTLDVCDDYDLILRTYDTGNWLHIPELALQAAHRANHPKEKERSHSRTCPRNLRSVSFAKIE